MATTSKDTVPDEVKKSEGKALKRLIELNGKGQPQIAADSEVGSKAYVSQMCTGHRPINADAAARLASALGVKIDAFSPRLADNIRDAARFVQQTGNTTQLPTQKVTDADSWRYNVEPLNTQDQWPFTVSLARVKRSLTLNDMARIDGFIAGILQTREGDLEDHTKSGNGSI
jgi:transcriptional regulator with XRE-family HTH domain